MRPAESRMWDRAAERLSISVEWLAECGLGVLADRWGSECLRFHTTDPGEPYDREAADLGAAFLERQNRACSWTDWRPQGPPAGRSGKYWRGKDRLCATGRPSVPFGLLTLLGLTGATNRVLVVEGLTDWLTALHMFPKSGIVGAQGTGSVADAVRRVVRCGMDPARIVAIIDHDEPDSRAARGGRDAIRDAQSNHPEISVLRPAAERADLSDG